jgi:hypothetical protein
MEKPTTGEVVSYFLAAALLAPVAWWLKSLFLTL